jgi:23S rRNA pseudouridine2457 synthase
MTSRRTRNSGTRKYNSRVDSFPGNAVMPLILFNKPFQVMCQFSPHPTRPTLADHIAVPGVYPAGRLDADSEGLVLLTDDGRLQHDISHPLKKLAKTYLAQVEGTVTKAALERLRAPLNLGDFTTLPCQAAQIEAPGWLWPRSPPIRQRAGIPASWLALTLTEGKNRQVRRMTAAVGLPTLRLVRIAIGPYALASHPLLPGEWQEVSPLEMR